MLNGSKKYKVFFPIQMNNGWLGGVNYYKNLFHAISLLDGNKIACYIPKGNPKILFEYATEVKKATSYYYFNKLKSNFLGKSFIKEMFLYGNLKTFDIISHANFFRENTSVISWIPDFQHKKLPEIFSNEEVMLRDSMFENFAKKSVAVIVSSNDAKNDFIKYYPEYSDKVRVLNFVSYIPNKIYEDTDNIKDIVQNKYHLPRKYFYLPNQFWVHKNHMTVFKAINELKKQNIDIQVICSGNTKDYRNRSYFNDVILKYINDNNLDKNIHILGIVNSDEVYYLMRNCISIINPSLFEGWSSTVEEAKSLGKNIILSDLAVHIEQNPPEGIFFERENYLQLANIMKKDWLSEHYGPNYKLEKQAKASMLPRMKKFGQCYLNIIDEVLKNKCN